MRIKELITNAFYKNEKATETLQAGGDGSVAHVLKLFADTDDDCSLSLNQGGIGMKVEIRREEEKLFLVITE